MRSEGRRLNRNQEQLLNRVVEAHQALMTARDRTTEASEALTAAMREAELAGVSINRMASACGVLWNAVGSRIRAAGTDDETERTER